MPRLFIGIRPPPVVLTHLVKRLSQFSSHSAASLRWVKPEGLHLTLRFLGMIKNEDVPAVEALLARVARSLDADFQISLAGAGSFRSRAGFSVVWLGVGEGAEPLAEIARRLELGLKQLGFPAEAKSFQPHLTIARGPSSPELEKMIESISKSDLAFGTFWARALVLYESETLPSGAVHHERARAEFRRPL